MFGYDRRKNFCIKTLLFFAESQLLYSATKTPLIKTISTSILKTFEEEGSLNGTPYKMEDSIHNHVRFMEQHIMHRKGSTELSKEKTVVIPLSMSRGSLLVQAGAAGCNGRGT